MPEFRPMVAANKKGGHKKDPVASGGIRIPNFTPAGPEIDIYAISYRDSVREQARQKRLQAVLKAGGKNAKQICAEQKKAALLQRQKDRRRDAIEKGRNPDKMGSKRGRNARLMDEWEDLAKEERLHKKLRRRKITQADHDKQLFGSVVAKGGFDMK